MQFSKKVKALLRKSLVFTTVFLFSACNLKEESETTTKITENADEDYGKDKETETKEDKKDKKASKTEEKDEGKEKSKESSNKNKYVDKKHVENTSKEKNKENKENKENLNDTTKENNKQEKTKSKATKANKQTNKKITAKKTTKQQSKKTTKKTKKPKVTTTKRKPTTKKTTKATTTKKATWSKVYKTVHHPAETKKVLVEEAHPQYIKDNCKIETFYITPEGEKKYIAIPFVIITDYYDTEDIFYTEYPETIKYYDSDAWVPEGCKAEGSYSLYIGIDEEPYGEMIPAKYEEKIVKAAYDEKVFSHYVNDITGETSPTKP